MIKCKRCNKTYTQNGYISHKCLPIWYVFDAEQYIDGEPCQIRAYDAEDAAEEYTARNDREDSNYFVAGDGEELEVTVSAFSDMRDSKKFVVTGEMAPQYWVREVK